MSDSSWPHEMQHTRLPCPSLSPRVCSNSYPLHQWCHPTISSSLTPFPPQSAPTSLSFPMSRPFTSGRKSIGASALVLPMNIQCWFSLRLTVILLQSKGLSRVFFSTIVQKHQFFVGQPSLWFNCHICTWILEKKQFDHTDLCQ